MTQFSPTEAAAWSRLRSAGYNDWIATALAQKGYDFESSALVIYEIDYEGERISDAAPALLSLEGLLGSVLEWYGICGYTSSIIAAVDNLRSMKAL